MIACPVLDRKDEGPLHISVSSETISGIVYCEQMKFFDLKKRSYRTVGRISYYDAINIADAVQSIFDYHEE